MRGDYALEGDEMDPPSTDSYHSKEIWLLKEQLAMATTEAQTYRVELASAQEEVTAVQSQLWTVKLEAEVDKL